MKEVNLGSERTIATLAAREIFRKYLIINEYKSKCKKHSHYLLKKPSAYTISYDVKGIHIEDHNNTEGRCLAPKNRKVIPMTTMSPTASTSQPHSGWFSRAEAWLDSKGKGAWIAAMVLGFIFFWPVGLAILAYMIWSKRMFSKSCTPRSFRNASSAMRPSGNTAFDAYKSDTLARLEREQSEFEAFLERLRDAKDKSEFDQFMDERARTANEADMDTA